MAVLKKGMAVAKRSTVDLPPRDVCGLLQAFRRFLLSKPYDKPHHRFAKEVAARTQCPPELPKGVYHLLSGNYYYERDGRGLVKPAAVVVPRRSIRPPECTCSPRSPLPGLLHAPNIK